MTKRRKDVRTEQDGDGERRTALERFFLSFMGPPQLGDLNAPVRKPARVEVCPTCGQPYGEHEVVRRPGYSYTRCRTD